MKPARIAAGIFLTVLLIAGLWWFGRNPSGDGQSTKLTTAPSPALPKVPKIRVAVYLSRYCASGADGTQWVYGHSCQMAGDLHDPALDIVPIIEPGTENIDTMPKLLDHFFPGATPADATNPAILKSFDVIVVPRINYLRDDVRQGIEAAVRNGTGLLIRNTFGNGVPGYTPEMAKLNGFDECEFTYNPKPVECEVLAGHPILGSLKKGDVIKITPNGPGGKLIAGSVPLIKVKNKDDIGGTDADPDFYPLFLSQLDKGRIAQCIFPAWEPTPAALQKATDNKFNVRLIKWLAKKPLD